MRNTPSAEGLVQTHRWLLLVAAVVTALLFTLAGVLWFDRIPVLESSPEPRATPEVVARGELLARAGNCMACHTERGGPAYAGGRAIATPFGTVYSSNLTPDPATGLGEWTANEFWRALHHGVGREGQRLNPAFPYTEFTRMTRTDSDALFLWLKTVPAASKAHRAHTLSPLVDHPVALAAWRTLFFRPGIWQDQPAQSAEWNRGAYWVQGPAHCISCHGDRNVLGGQWSTQFVGGLLPSKAWYAPSLQHAEEASVARWPINDIVALLRDGVAPQGRVSGPMAEVVQHGTQHMPEAELRAMAVFLQSLPVLPARARPKADPTDPARLQKGEALYGDHCASCHGKSGDGGVTPAGELVAPALVGNRLLSQEPAVNLVRQIALGGFGVESRAHPRPFSMPGYAGTLNDDQLADVTSFVRHRWGGQASGVSSFDVGRWRGDAD